MLRRHKKTNLNKKGQVILEFTFCMVVILLMLYGAVKVFFWTGQDVAERRIAHEAVLMNSAASVVPIQQIDPYFYTPVKMNAVWNGN